MKIWRLPAGLMVVALLTWPTGGHSSPVVGRVSRDEVSLPAGKSPAGRWEQKVDFLGGERACVIVRGDHKPIVDVGISIFDAKDRLVARDNGKGDLAAVIWYPPETGTYMIVVTNPNDVVNICQVTVR